jgi:hypothetical protein
MLYAVLFFQAARVHLPDLEKLAFMPTLRTWINHPREHEANSGLRRVGIPISARTVGELLAEASRVLGVRFQQHEGPMWFRAYGIPPYDDVGWIVDVRIIRGDADIYPLRPERNTSFPLEDSDIISIYIITD